jgi:hypothetical protein
MTYLCQATKTLATFGFGFGFPLFIFFEADFILPDHCTEFGIVKIFAIIVIIQWTFRISF